MIGNMATAPEHRSLNHSAGSHAINHSILSKKNLHMQEVDDAEAWLGWTLYSDMKPNFM